MLPLGLKAYEKLTRLIDEEMEAIGGEKMSMTTLAPDKLWKRTGEVFVFSFLNAVKL